MTIALAPDTTPTRTTLVELGLRKVGQWWCRHRDQLVVRGRGEMFLQCSWCGRESVGFHVGPQPPEGRAS